MILSTPPLYNHFASFCVLACVRARVKRMYCAPQQARGHTNAINKLMMKLGNKRDQRVECIQKKIHIIFLIRTLSYSHSLTYFTHYILHHYIFIHSLAFL